jgi:hypothetical protein
MDWLPTTNHIMWTKATDIRLDFLPYRFPVRTPHTQEAEIRQIETCVKKGYPRLHLQDLRDEWLSVVGYGPSLHDTWKEITHPCITVSGALDFMQDHGVIPDFHAECDGRDYKTKHLEHANKETKYFMASVCNPRMWDLLEGCDVSYWHTANGQHVVDWIGKNDVNSILIAGGSNIGLCAIHIGGILGFRKFRLFGFDGNYRGDIRHAGPHYAEPQRRIMRAANGRTWETSPQMFNACDEFLRLYDNPECRFEIVGESLLGDLVVEADKGKGFWDGLLMGITKEMIQETTDLLKASETRRPRASYNTGSISHLASLALRLLTERLKPEVIAEVGTFIGTSTTSMRGGHIYTVDKDNDCLESTEGITCHPGKTSTEMFASLVEKGVKVDMFFIDGRLQWADMPLILRLCKPSTVFAFDDYYGQEKGVVNVEVLKPYFPSYKLIRPCGPVRQGTTIAVMMPCK